MSWRVLDGDATERLRELDASSVQTCITSPPYWGLRSYGHDDQLGLEPTPEQYVTNLVAVFREVRRVLRDDGTVWLNLGDSYFGTGRGPSNDRKPAGLHSNVTESGGFPLTNLYSHPEMKSKDLCGIPWMVAFALRADGWWLRSDIVWAKPNPMPESVTDRPTRSHEYIFLLTKSARYFYDADAIREEHEHPNATRTRGTCAPGSLQENLGKYWQTENGNHPGGRNKRSVWTVATQPFPGAHFATFPPKLIEPCVLAGSPPKCCGECGAPHRRVTETERVERSDGGRSVRRADLAESTLSESSMMRTNAVPVSKTVGWWPTCGTGCANNIDTKPSTVLDPFAGAGTTGVVALRHDRDFIGIELNPAYAEMARNRIRDDAPLLNWQGEA